MSNTSDQELPDLQLANANTPGAKWVRRISVYFSYGEGHTYILEEGDDLIDPLLPPEDLSDPERVAWVPKPIDLVIPKLYIVRAIHPVTGAEVQESIYLKHVAYLKYMAFWAVRKVKPSTPPSVAPMKRQGGAPAFRDGRPRREDEKQESGKDPVILPPGA